MQESWLS